MTTHAHKRRRELLGSAGTAIALLVAGSTLGAQTAAAASTNSGAATANANKTAVSETTNVATVSASIDDTIGGVQTDATSGGSTTNAASGNDVLAGATGNAFHNQIDLSTVTGSGATGGAAALGLATNNAAATITSAVTDNTIGLQLNGFTNGSAVNDGNTISATTTANRGSTLREGAIRNDFSSTAMGDVDTARTVAGVTTATATGGLIAATRQTSVDPANSAIAAGNTIATSIENTADATVTASPSVSGNTIAATVQGNASQSTIDIAGDDTPQYAGSAVVANFQESLGEGTSTAINVDSSVIGEVFSDGIFVSTLNGTLAVENNAISSNASNNTALGGAERAGNEILLDDALSFDGNLPLSAFGVARTTSNYSAATTADLGVQNVQTAMGDDADDRLVTTAQTLAGEVFGGAEALAGGSIAVSGNAITATAQSNAASNRIANGENAASFAGTVAASNVQDNNAVSISASNLGGAIGGLVADGFTASSVESNRNAINASAYGNQVSQSVDLQATTLGIGAAEAYALTSADNGSIAAVGTITVGNLQANADTDVAADQSSIISADWLAASDSSMVGSSLTATRNRQEAVALGNSAGNALSLEGTTVGSGAGVANYQTADAASSVAATSTGLVAAFAGDTITGSEMTVSDNVQRAIAYGASSGNTVSVTGNTLVLAPSGPTDVASTATLGMVNPSALSPQVRSAYNIFNRQSQAGDVSATAVSDTAFENIVEGDVTSGGTLQTDRNSLVAAAYGTDASNIASVDANSIDTDSDGYAAVTAVTNAQNVTDAAVVARAAGESAILTDIYGDAVNAAVSTSENTVKALAYGNRSTENRVTVNATNVDTSVDDLPLRGSARFDVLGNTATVDASFAAHNAQASSGEITASLLTADIDPSATEIRTRIGESVTGSSVVSNDNTLAADAIANRAATSVLLDANQLVTTAGVQNSQFNSADLSALIGIAGTAGSPGDPGTSPIPVTASGSSGVGTMSPSGNDLTVAGAPVTVTFTGYTFSADEAAYLNTLTGISGATAGGNTLTFGIGTIDTSAFNNFIPNSGSEGFGTGDETFTITGFTIPGTPPTPGIAASPNQGGVTIAISEDVFGSAVSVSGNSTSGSVLGNSAVNAVIATATDIAGGSGQASSTATTTSATADLALSNVQADSADTQTSTVYGTFAIDATDGDIGGSSLTVSNNKQRSDAGSNLATNVIDASATNLSAGSALSSYQDSSAAVSALSNLDVFAPGASTQSTTKMNANTNTARAVVNEANNTVRVAATNVDPVSAPNLVANPNSQVLIADHVLVSVQGASGSASSTASSQIFNGDAAELATNGLSSGSIEIAGNTTTAQSVANLATNTMTVEASANQGASAGVNNVQLNMAAVSANATSTATVALAGDSTAIPQVAATDDATVRITGNATTAFARGNSAANVHNLDAGATYGTPGAGTPGVDFGPGGTVTAFAATGGVLNQQTNMATVSATSTGVSYQVALNGPGISPVVTGSSTSVSGNAVNAEAFGNTASNRIAMTALNSGTPSAAIGNYQNNTGAVSATVTTVGYGVTAGSGVIGGSSFTTTGNRVAATAVGNNAVSVIAAGN